MSTPLGTIFKSHPREQADNQVAGFTTEEIAAHRKSYLNSLEEEISSREWSTLLLSAEGVSNFFVSELAKLCEWGEKYSSDWTVLICVRHPVGYVRSVIQQLLKSGDTLQRLYEKPPMPSYSIRVSNAMSVFGKESVRVFDFDAATKGDGSIVGTFAAQVGLAASSCDFLASRAVRDNESLSSEAVHILDSLNRQRPMLVDNVRAPRRSGPGHELPYISRIKGQKFDVPDSVKESIRVQSREDVAWLNETFELDLYRDVTDVATHAESHEEPVEALSDPAIDSIAGIFGELVTADVYRRSISQGRVAMGRGDLERAEKMFQEAARLDPDAPQPEKLLKEVTEKQKANTGELDPQEQTEKRANYVSFLRRLWR